MFAGEPEVEWLLPVHFGVGHDGPRAGVAIGFSTGCCPFDRGDIQCAVSDQLLDAFVVEAGWDDGVGCLSPGDPQLDERGEYRERAEVPYSCERHQLDAKGLGDVSCEPEEHRLVDLGKWVVKQQRGALVTEPASPTGREQRGEDQGDCDTFAARGDGEVFDGFVFSVQRV